MNNIELLGLVELTINCLDKTKTREIVDKKHFIESYLKQDKTKKLKQIENYLNCINFLKNEILTLEKAKHYYSFLQYLAKFQASYKFKKSKNEIFYLSFKGLVILKKLLIEY